MLNLYTNIWEQSGHIFDKRQTKLTENFLALCRVHIKIVISITYLNIYKKRTKIAPKRHG